MAAPRWRLPDHARRPLLHLTGMVLALLLWWLGARLLPDSYAGFRPAATFAALWELIGTSYFQSGVIDSLTRLFLGLGIAVAIGIPVGLLVGYVRVLNDLTYLLFQFLRMISPLAWTPIAIIAFGVGAAPVVFLVAIAAVWPVVINTTHGVQKVDEVWLQVARIFGAGGFTTVRRVVLPAILPDIVSGLRVALGVSWIVLVPAEMLGVPSGLGYMILDFRDVVDYASLTAAILTIGFLGYLTDQLLLRLMRQVSWSR